MKPYADFTPENLEKIIRENLSKFFSCDSSRRTWIYADGKVRLASAAEEWDGMGIRPIIVPVQDWPQDVDGFEMDSIEEWDDDLWEDMADHTLQFVMEEVTRKAQEE